MKASDHLLELVLGAPSDGSHINTAGFLDHRVDLGLVKSAVAELSGSLPNCQCVLTSESGFATAFALADQLGLPVVVARHKVKPPLEDSSRVEIAGDHLFVSKNAIPLGSRVLIADGVLGGGRAQLALAMLVESLNSHVVGVATLVEKTFQTGRSLLETNNVPVFSLVKVAKRGSDLIAERRY